MKISLGRVKELSNMGEGINYFKIKEKIDFIIDNDLL
jgi:hypothetical protein